MRDMKKGTTAVLLFLYACGPTRVYVGEGCQDFCDAIIAGGYRCNLVKQSEVAIATSGCVEGCCGDSRTCQRKLKQPNNIDACLAEIQQWTCAEALNLSLPAICYGVIDAE